MRIKICDFTKRELYMLRRACNFTPMELELFTLRSRGEEYTVEKCAEEMNCSPDTAYRILKKVLDKIERVCGIKPKINPKK